MSARKVTPDVIDAALDRCTFHVVSQPGGSTSTFVHAFLDGQFYVASGHSACVSPENFDASTGEQIARQKCEAATREKLWELYGFQLYAKLQADDALPKPTHGLGYPLYRGTKFVRAFWIKEIHHHGPRPGDEKHVATLYPTYDDQPPYAVTQAWLDKHDPKEGDIVVFYADGYVSLSPLNAFNDAYVREDA